MRILIMRHSETEWNRQHKIQGLSDLHLNLGGMKIAALTGEGMKDIPIDVCFSSPLCRAQETAALVVARNPRFLEAGGHIHLDERLKEINFGEWEGKDGSYSGMDVDPKEFEMFFSTLDSGFVPKGAESLRSVVERSGNFLDELIARKDLQDKTVLVVSHGCTMRCMLYRFAEDKENYFRNPKVLFNCQTAEVETGPEGEARLLSTDLLFYDRSLARNYYK